MFEWTLFQLFCDFQVLIRQTYSNKTMGPRIISVIGYIDMDFTMTTPRLPDVGESLQARGYSASPGGKGANAAVAAFRSVHKKIHHGDTAGQFHFEYPYKGEEDIQVRMIGAVGQDGNGPLAVQNLKENGVDISGVKVLAGEVTGICFCLVDSYTGENRLLYTPGATATIEPEEFMTPDSLGNGVIPDLIISQLECRIRTVEQLIKTAGEAGIDVLLNAAPAAQILPQTYQYLTHLIVNESEAAMLSGREVENVVKETWLEIAEEFLLWKVKNVVITLGAQGAFYATANGKNGHVPAEKVKVLDATGAG